MAKNRPVILAILDGWGIAPASASNAVSVAKTPNMDQWVADYPSTSLIAHNGLVGLPKGQMGNSEVGHLNIGSGRIVYQDYTRINRAVEQEEFAKNPVLNKVMDQVKAAGSRIHFCGLLSDGGVHSHLKHLEALLAMAGSRGLEAKIHCFMDGRDTPPSSGAGYMEELLAAIKRIGCGQVATVSGRYWAMDRDTRWDRVEKAWQALVDGQGITAEDPLQAVKDSYSREETDEFIKPTVLLNDAGEAVGRISDGNAIVFFNFRADRVRELCHAFSDADFQGFDVSNRPKLLELVTMTEYEADFDFPIVFPPVSLTRILGEEASEAGLHQLRIAETEKYAHVTYFFNGGAETPFPGEDRILIESPRDVATYDQKPAMSAIEVTDRLLAALKDQEEAGTPYDLVILNFANTDMVGHTGILNAAVQACETVDTCLGRIAEQVQAMGGVLLVTADHGNAETMVNLETGQPHTAHTLNPVPLILVSEAHKGCTLKDGGALKDIAPTLMHLLGLKQPEEMEGENLIA
ncbi:MAG: 2,3-bisphosphoglycerate-independent phosphoglycerate mutase [Candidatus Electrothrix aestuarii]|uniref:2,3-bisphosphoglycerate-independent phosphoglycerate mutase n=1 Tax=Candidatus Electrothrix aestuarii TaxID=3062594 RepID=A0AAU8M1Z7_9BACT|nr:2,3-bisphosphoglycerate-independent phosphoglycerate mutase [Candidatus Electrothrix aestuarii]